MTGELARWSGASSHPRIVARRASRELAERVSVAQADGIVAATRVEMGGFVAQVALHHVGMASETEARLTKRSPTGAARYQLVADALAGLAASEVDGLAMKWRQSR